MKEIPKYLKLANGTLKLTNPKPLDYCHDVYWGVDGKSTLEDQRYNLEEHLNADGISKVDYVLRRCVGDTLLEIGCAPGSLLRVARERGFDAVGIEPNMSYIDAIIAHSGCTVLCGLFPDVLSVPLLAGHSFDSIVAMDVLEHVDDPEAFVAAALAVLKPGGRLILMIPARLDDGLYREQDMHFEHLHLFSEKHLREWLNPVEVSRWERGHEVIIVEKA
jgi:2-polyprenyl-3-methyl-5-hydroxy-6-metoxy-1,4-benzoquinol methylase